MEIKSPTDLGQRIEKYFRDSVLKPSGERTEGFLKDFDQNPRHALEWGVEDIMKWQETERLWARLCVTVRECATEHQVKRSVQDHVAEVAKHVLRFPPRHNSTGEVSNLWSMCENAARCDFIQKCAEFTGDFTYCT